MFQGGNVKYARIVRAAEVNNKKNNYAENIKWGKRKFAFNRVSAAVSSSN